MTDEIPTETLELKEVADKLHCVAKKWLLLGIQLEVPAPTLQSISAAHRIDHEKALIDMLGVWLEQGQNVSWETIVEALKARSVNEVGLANIIMERSTR